MTEVEKLKLFKEKGFTYNPETGEVFSSTGKLQKSKDVCGYITISTRIGERKYNKTLRVKSHRFAWFLYHGDIDDTLQIDHINQIKIDNRIENLRLVNQNKNQWNRDCKGFSFYEKLQKYKSQIRVDGKDFYLGYFDTEKEAHEAYLEAKKKYHIINE
jgi:hypothetical protein